VSFSRRALVTVTVCFWTQRKRAALILRLNEETSSR
jgi:hypothetical protein